MDDKVATLAAACCEEAVGGAQVALDVGLHRLRVVDLKVGCHDAGKTAQDVALAAANVGPVATENVGIRTQAFFSFDNLS